MSKFHMWFEYITPRGWGLYTDPFSFAHFWSTFNSLVVYIPNKEEGTYQYDGLMTSDSFVELCHCGYMVCVIKQ